MNQQPKYHIGQEVWRISDRKASKVLVNGVVIVGKDFQYYIDKIENLPYDFGWREESELFPTKEELINSLIYD